MSRKNDKEYYKLLNEMAVIVIYISFDNKDLISAILKLTDIERIIIVFRYVLDMEFSDLAVILDKTTNNVYVRKYKARNKLQFYLEDY